MVAQNPLGSLSDYSRFVAALVDRPTVLHSTLVVWSVSPYTGIAEGEVFLQKVRSSSQRASGCVYWKNSTSMPG